MKLKIGRAALLKVLGQVSSVVETRNTIPILSNVLIEVGKEVLTVTGSDLDIQIVETSNAEVKRQGATTVSARTLFDVARKMPEGLISIEQEPGEHKLIVSGGRARFSLPTLPREDFPQIVESELPTRFEMKVAELKTAIDATRFCVSTEETRYYLNGLFFHVDRELELLKIVATDGHRLARYSLTLPDDADELPDIIVPRKAIGLVRKLLDAAASDGAEILEVAASASKIRFHLGTGVLTAKLIDGTFPDYTRVIPIGNDKLLRIDPRSLMQGADRVAAIANDKTRAVKLALGKDKVTLSVTSPENGTAAEDVPGDYAAAALEVGFNARYLTDVLGAIAGDVCEVHLADAAAPTLVQAHEGAPALFVIMPMRV